jgi:hypothetical protein
MKLTVENRQLGEKPVPVPLCPPQIPHGLTRDRTRASTVRVVLYEELLIAQLVMRFCVVFKNRRYIAVFRILPLDSQSNKSNPF